MFSGDFRLSKTPNEKRFTLTKTKTVIILTITMIVIGISIFQTVHANPCQMYAYKANLDYVRFLEDKLGRELVQEKLAEDKIDPPPEEIEDWVFWECMTFKPLTEVSIGLRMSEEKIIEDLQG